MPPKKAAEPPKSYPEVEEEIQLPEDVGDLPEPRFSLALGHVFGHTFKVRPSREPPAAVAAGDEDGAVAAEAAEPAPPEPLVEFDPQGILIQRAKAPTTTQESILAKRVATMDREEMQLLSKGADGEALPLTHGLRVRLEKEREARARAKLNAARRKAIAAHEAAKAAAAKAAEEEAQGGDGAAAGDGQGAGATAPASVQQAADDEAEKVDFVLLTLDYPSTVDEVRELAAAGLCSQEVVDVWAAVYFAGVGRELTEEEAATMANDEANADREGLGSDDEPRLEVFEPPELVRGIYDVIQSAPAGSELATCTVSVLRDSQALALFGPEATAERQAEKVEDSLLTALGGEAHSLRDFKSWISAAAKVTVPDKDPKKGEARLYHRMMSSMDASHHDVPLFLHCLTEQVQHTSGGEAQRHEDDIAMQSLAGFLGAACDDLLSDGTGAPPRPSTARRGDADEPKVAGVGDRVAVEPILSYLDRSACTHHLGSMGGDAVVEGERIVDSARLVVDQVRVAGAKRQGLPRDSLHSTAQREALASRLYPFASEVSPVELEQLTLLHAFEELLSRAQPERRSPWCLSNRTVRERIPASLLPQTLEAAFLTEAFVSTAHIPRHDALLVALHYRSPAGRVLWHACRGDLFTEPESERWRSGLFSTPTFNDWAQVFGGRSGEAPKPCFLLEGFDAREMGYGSTFEKLATPPDGSIILATRHELGLSRSFPEPVNALSQPAVDADMAERRSVLDDAGSTATGVTALAVQKETPAAKLRVARCEVPPRKVSRLARIIKDGHAFGIVSDRSFRDWLVDFGKRRAEAAAVRAAAAAAAAEAAAAAVAAAESGGAEEEAGAGGDLGRRAAEAAEEAAAAAEQAARAASGLPFETAALGHFWLAFPGGARCSARMHHERALAALGLDEADGDLPNMGVLLTYTMAAGQVIQVLGDGTVCLSCPLELCEGAALRESTGADEAGKPQQQNQPQRRPMKNPSFAPGCPRDEEVLRSITLDGVVCRRLLTGRVEVYHPDGTAAWRNPTQEELQCRLEDLRIRPGGLAAHAVELLERIAKGYGDQHHGPMVEPPTEQAKSEGLPGHWVIVCRDGRVFGRAPAEPVPEAPQDVAAVAPESAAPAADPAPADEAAPGDRSAEEVERPPARPSLQELVGADLVDAGRVLEYEIRTIPAALQEDLLTKHRASTNAHGLACFEDPHGVQRVSVHRDGTQITTTKREDGHDVEVVREPLAFVRCELSEDPGAPGGRAPPRAIVECADGAVLEVELTEDGAGGPAPRARVELRMRAGSKVVSTGDGTVEVCTRHGGIEHQGGCYTAMCGEGRIVLKGLQSSSAETADGETETQGDFELLADQSVRVPELVDSYLERPQRSPRCMTSGTAYRLPGSEWMQAPELSHQPRLFVIYGDGEAEELLDVENAKMILDEAAEDPNAQVLEGPDVGAECQSKTIFRKRQPDALVVPPLGSLALPEKFDAKRGNSTYSVLEASSCRDAEVPVPAITEYRQFLEFPSVSAEMREKFKGTFNQYRDWEALQVARSRYSMQGPDIAKGKKDAKKDKKVDDKKDKKAKKGKKNVVVEVQEEPEEKPPEPAFVQDFSISSFQHQVEVLKMRAAAVQRPGGEDCLKYALEARKKDAEADGEEEEAPTTFTVKVESIDFESLQERPTLLGSVREAVKSAFAMQAGEGVLPEHVHIQFSAGSLIVEATIDAPDAVRRRLASGALDAAAVASAVAGVAGIEEVAVGAIQAAAGPAAAGPGAGPASPEAGAAGAAGAGAAGAPADEASLEAEVPPPAPSAPASAASGGGLAAAGDGAGTPEPEPSSRESEDPEGLATAVTAEDGARQEAEILDRKCSVRTGKRRLELSANYWEVYDPADTQHEEKQEACDQSDNFQPYTEQNGFSAEDGATQEARKAKDTRPPPEMKFAATYEPQPLPAMSIQRGAGPPIVADRADPPDGPHPDKKGSRWDHKGELRPAKPPVSQAYMEINTGYLEVEAATDRRVRTASVAHKKNAARAPSVQEVRKVGAHATGKGSTISAKDIVGDIRDIGAGEHWKLTSTMQGLGDSNNLVEVVPGACRFGPLCLGNVYRMSFYVRNLDVDVMRYVITSGGRDKPSDFVKICHTPGELVGDAHKITGHLAPGMAKKVTVEIAAHAPAIVEQLIEVTVKAHHVKVPVFARILDVEEYEKEDYTEMAIRNRHIGRSQERDMPSGGKPPPVEQVADPMYCKQVFEKISKKLNRDTFHLPPIQGDCHAGYPPQR